MPSFGDQYWEQAFAARPWGKYPSEELVRFYFGARKILPPSPSTLDIGCGAGAAAWFLARNGARVTAIDGAPSALKQMERTLAEFGAPAVVSLLGDITRPRAFVSGSFEVLVDHYSLYANAEESVATALQDYHSLLAPGGRFLSCMFGKGCTGAEAGLHAGRNTYSSLAHGPHAGTGTITLWTADEAAQLFASAGFQVVAGETQLHRRNGMVIEKLVFQLART